MGRPLWSSANRCLNSDSAPVEYDLGSVPTSGIYPQWGQGREAAKAESQLNRSSIMRIVLFLCTGNYYRSRFAEELFNARAAEARLNWRAESRALAIERLKENIGPLSPLVITALAELGLSPAAAGRVPTSCAREDLASADRIIALSDAEHRQLMLDRYPDWHDRTEFWDIEDVGLTPSSIALPAIRRRIDALIRELSAGAMRDTRENG